MTTTPTFPPRVTHGGRRALSQAQGPERGKAWVCSRLPLLLMGQEIRAASPAENVFIYNSEDGRGRGRREMCWALAQLAPGHRDHSPPQQPGLGSNPPV